ASIGTILQSHRTPSETAPVRGAKLGPSGGNGAGAARDVRLQPITSSSPPLFSFAHCPDFKSRDSTERPSDQAPLASRALAPIDRHTASRSNRTHQRPS